MQNLALFGDGPLQIPASSMVSLRDTTRDVEMPLLVTQVRTKLPIPMYKRSKDCMFLDTCGEASAEGDSSSLPLFGRTFYLASGLPESSMEEFVQRVKPHVNSTDPDVLTEESSLEMKAFYGRSQLVTTTVGVAARTKREYIDCRGEDGKVAMLHVFGILIQEFSTKFQRTPLGGGKRNRMISFIDSEQFLGHTGFITAFYNVGDDGYPSMPSEFSSFILEWCTVNDIAGFITSSAMNPSTINRDPRRYKRSAPTPFKLAEGLGDDDIFITVVDPGKYFDFTMSGLTSPLPTEIPPSDSSLLIGVEEDWRPARDESLGIHFSDPANYILWFYLVLKRNFKQNEGDLTFDMRVRIVTTFMNRVLPNISFYVKDPSHYDMLMQPDFGVGSKEFTDHKPSFAIRQMDKGLAFLTRRIVGIEYRTDALIRNGNPGDVNLPFNIVDFLDELSLRTDVTKLGYLDSGVNMMRLYAELLSSYGKAEMKEIDLEDLVTPPRGEVTPHESPISVTAEIVQFDNIRELVHYYNSIGTLRDFLQLPDVSGSPISPERVITPPYGLNSILSGRLNYGQLRGTIRKNPYVLSSLASTSTTEDRTLRVNVRIPGSDIYQQDVDRAPAHIYPYFDPQRCIKIGEGDISKALLLHSAMPDSGVLKTQLFNSGMNTMMPCGLMQNLDKTTSLVTTLPTRTPGDEPLSVKRGRLSQWLRTSNDYKRKGIAIETNKTKRILMAKTKYSRWLQWYQSKVDSKGTLEDLYVFVRESYYVSREEDVPTTPITSDDILKMGLLAPENAMFMNPDDSKVPQTYLEIDWICCTTASLLFGRLPGYTLDQESITFSKEAGDVNVLMKNVNVQQGIPSLSAKLWNKTWLSEWMDQGAYDEPGDDTFKTDPFKHTSDIRDPQSADREMDPGNIWFYFSNVLGIEETDEYAVINLAEFEIRSVGSPIPGIDDQSARLRKVWSEISRFGNLSKLPREVRPPGDAWDTPMYLDTIPAGGWNGLRCIFIVGRTSKSRNFMDNIIREDVIPSANLHWVLMALITGDVSGDTRQILFYDAMMGPGRESQYENHMLTQMSLYGIISPEGRTVASNGYSVDSGTDYTSISSILSRSEYSIMGYYGVYNIEDNPDDLFTNGVIQSMIDIARENQTKDAYTGNYIYVGIESELREYSIDRRGRYSGITPASMTRISIYLSQMLKIPGAYFSNDFKERKGDDILYVTRPGPYLKNAVLQKEDWECGYFTCAMARHIMTIGKAYSLPPSNGGIELSWCAESIGLGGADCYVIPGDGINYAGMYPLWPREDLIDKSETGDDSGAFNRYSFYLYRLLYPILVNMNASSLPWNRRLPLFIQVPTNPTYLKGVSEDYHSIFVVGDVLRFGDNEKFGDTLYRITRSHSIAVVNDAINQIETYSVPRDETGSDMSSDPNIHLDVPWRPQILKHAYPIESPLISTKLAAYSQIGESVDDRAIDLLDKTYSDFTDMPFVYTGDSM